MTAPAGTSRRPRGSITSSQDTLSEQEHTVALTCQDHLALMKRRFLTRGMNPMWGQDQDQMGVANWCSMASGIYRVGRRDPGFSYDPADNLGMFAAQVYPDAGPSTGR